MEKGLLVVVSGPSGVGKGTICQKLYQEKDIVQSVSVTTRSARAGEINGVHYYFKTIDEYKAMKEANEFLETFEVFGNFYGTPKKKVFDEMEKGNNVLLEIDVQGGLNVKKNFSDSVLIFVLPPSREELKARLIGRKTESEAQIEIRTAKAVQEMKEYANYDYIVVNDDLDTCINQIKNIINSEKNKTSRNIDFAEKIIKGDKND